MIYQITNKLKVKTPEGIRELQAGEVIDLSEGMAKGLIEQGRIRPISQNIPFDTLKTLYLDAFNRVGWTQGLMARPEVQKAEDRFNEVWLEAMEGRAGIEDFKQTLNEWELTISKVIRLIRG